MTLILRRLPIKSLAACADLCKRVRSESILRWMFSWMAGSCQARDKGCPARQLELSDSVGYVRKNHYICLLEHCTNKLIEMKHMNLFKYLSLPALILLAACSSQKAEDQSAFQVENPFGHPFIPDMIADAGISEFDGVFYCYATTDGYGQGLATSGPPTVWKSEDFVNWSFEGTSFPSAAEQKYWAPSRVVKANGKYYLYPTINNFMYAAISDNPDGPYRLAMGEDQFELPYSEASTLLQGKERSGIDTEVFIDDDGQAYAFWGRRCVARLNKEMTCVEGKIDTIKTARGGYSEGPIIFKRKGIYYYLYTLKGHEAYQYAYMMSRTSPMGPYEKPEEDILSTTDYEAGVFGPGHGNVFCVEGTDDHYFVYLEFSRSSTNRQSYINRMEFNEDGTIRPIKLSLDGVGALRNKPVEKPLEVVECFASSSMAPLKIPHIKDPKCQRTEYFQPAFAFDQSNGTRWMAAQGDTLQSWLVADLGKVTPVKRSDIYFVQPTAGHAYTLEGSVDGTNWQACGGKSEIEKRSPHSDLIGQSYRYLRVRITQGTSGIWEWKIYP